MLYLQSLVAAAGCCVAAASSLLLPLAPVDPPSTPHALPRPFPLSAPSLPLVFRDECPQRGMLMTALRVFEALHAAVFARLPQAPLSTDPSACAVWDVRNVMAAEKKRVGEGDVGCLVVVRSTRRGRKGGGTLGGRGCGRARQGERRGLITAGIWKWVGKGV